MCFLSLLGVLEIPGYYISIKKGFQDVQTDLDCMAFYVGGAAAAALCPDQRLSLLGKCSCV